MRMRQDIASWSSTGMTRIRYIAAAQSSPSLSVAEHASFQQQATGRERTVERVEMKKGERCVRRGEGGGGWGGRLLGGHETDLATMVV